MPASTKLAASIAPWRAQLELAHGLLVRRLVGPQPPGDDHLLQEVDLDVGAPGEAPRESARDRRLAGPGNAGDEDRARRARQEVGHGRVRSRAR
jgi:hypothetical protein